MEYKDLLIKLKPDEDGYYNIELNGRKITVSKSIVQLFYEGEDILLKGLDGTTFKSVEIKNK